MDIGALVDFALSSLPAKFIALVMALSALCSAIIAIWPPPKNLRTAIGFLWQGIDWVALNIHHGQTASKAIRKGNVVPASSLPIAVLTQIRGSQTQAKARDKGI